MPRVHQTTLQMQALQDLPFYLFGVPTPFRSTTSVEDPLIRMSTSQGPRTAPHGSSPFPTFCEARRAVHGQSATSFQGADSGHPRHTPASTTSLHQRRSPPLAAQIIPGRVRCATSPLRRATGPDDRTERSPPISSVNPQSILHQITPQHDRSRSQSDPLRDRVPQMITAPDSVPHPVRPRIMSHDGFQMTPELIAEIDLAHDMSKGKAGVAYAGGALSGPVSRSTPRKPSTLPNKSTLEHVRSGNRLSLGQLGETSTRVQSRNTNPCVQSRETLRLHHRDSGMHEPSQRTPAQPPSPTLEVQRTNSPKHPNDHPASYNPGGRELRSAMATAPSPSPPSPRQNVLRMEPLRSMPNSAARISDKTFPIHEDSPTVPSDPVAAHDHGRPHSLIGSHSLLGSSISPNPHSLTAAPPPSPIVTGMSREKGKKPVRPPYNPVQHVDSPSPDPIEHIRRRSNGSPENKTMGNPQVDSKSTREQLALQMQAFALKNGGMVSDSTLSPSSAPFPRPQYNPWTFMQTNNVFSGKRSGIANSQASTHSSPSHQLVPLPPFSRGSRRRRCREHPQDLPRQPKTRPPPRVESTQPRDTSPELASSEETSVESTIGERRSAPQQSTPQPAAHRDESADDEDTAETDDGRWIDEDLEDGCGIDCLLHLGDAKKRRRRLRWEALLREFHALDCETDTPFVLLAAPSHTGKLHSVASRTVRHDSSLKPAEMKHIRSAFAEITSRQHAARTPSLLEQLSRACLSSYDGPSSSSGGARDKDLLRALNAVIGSLHELGTIYERREKRRAEEVRRAEEMRRLDEDNDRAQLLLKLVLGPSVFGNLANTAR